MNEPKIPLFPRPERVFVLISIRENWSHFGKNPVLNFLKIAD
jgi:hypothetical protein